MDDSPSPSASASPSPLSSLATPSIMSSLASPISLSASPKPTPSPSRKQLLYSHISRFIRAAKPYKAKFSKALMARDLKEQEYDRSDVMIELETEELDKLVALVTKFFRELVCLLYSERVGADMSLHGNQGLIACCQKLYSFLDYDAGSLCVLRLAVMEEIDKRINMSKCNPNDRKWIQSLLTSTSPPINSWWCSLIGFYPSRLLNFFEA